MVLAWHFVGATLRDGHPIPADGKWLVHIGPVEICSTGLHASRRPADALEYAPGPVLCRVECDDVIDEQADKLVCRRRRIIQRADITETLRYYARMQALSVLHLWPDDPPDVVLDYLMTGDESIRDAAAAAAQAAARAATWAAAWDAARAVAGAAASVAVWETAWAAAWDAARAVAGAAARAAAGAAASVAVWETPGDEFDSLIYEQFGEQP